MSDRRGGSGMNLGGVLLVIFIVLKLSGVIGWSWWWVMSPLWIGAIAFVIGCSLIGLYRIFVR